MGKSITAVRLWKILIQRCAKCRIWDTSFCLSPSEKECQKFSKFLQINKGLIAEARLRGHGEKDGRKLGDLEILAEFQHYGAATGLIDFTYNAQIALYFACQKDVKWERDSEDSMEAPDGKVYVVLNDPDKFQKIAPDLLEKRVDEFFQGSQLYHWEPGYHNNRVIAQQSVFLFGASEIDGDAACVIKKNNKQNILLELERVSGITQAMLFPDFDGFARLYSEDVLYTELSALDYEEYAREAYFSDQYKEAIKNYDMAIKLSPPKFVSLPMARKGKEFNEAIYGRNLLTLTKLLR